MKEPRINTFLRALKFRQDYKPPDFFIRSLLSARFEEFCHKPKHTQPTNHETGISKPGCRFVEMLTSPQARLRDVEIKGFARKTGQYRSPRYRRDIVQTFPLHRGSLLLKAFLLAPETSGTERVASRKNRRCRSISFRHFEMYRFPSRYSPDGDHFWNVVSKLEVLSIRVERIFREKGGALYFWMLGHRYCSVTGFQIYDNLGRIVWQDSIFHQFISEVKGHRV